MKTSFPFCGISHALSVLSCLPVCDMLCSAHNHDFVLGCAIFVLYFSCLSGATALCGFCLVLFCSIILVFLIDSPCCCVIIFGLFDGFGFFFPESVLSSVPQSVVFVLCSPLFRCDNAHCRHYGA